MIEALLSGKLQGQPEQRTSKAGRAFVTARMRVSAGAEEAHFVRLTAFSETACTALMALGDGDAVAVAGTLKPGAWIDRDGNAKPNLDVVVAQVLTLYGLERRRKATQPGNEEGSEQRGGAAGSRSTQRWQAAQQRGTGVGAEPDDFGQTGDDAWLAGERL